ncbi:uncharacterized protein LOC119653004 [Hermetia illucens]|uniref:uncharacterized protein LOC119653004 n=1 Tax=Hermetia illucens TaxID=343691 RepID=UPI0018CC60C7|nr:uncharacterized protein LOC119653004 [Hermetia illucens]
MTDPWVVRDGENSINSELTVDSEAENTNGVGFEDDFTSTERNSSANQIQNLPDSQQYLESLEKKLKRLKRDPNILRQLAAKREEFIGNLLNDNLFINRDDELALDAPIVTGESAVHEIYRHLRPVQPLNVGETVNIVHYDQLEEQRVQDEGLSEDSETASR